MTFRRKQDFLLAPQSIDKGNALPDAEKACKARKQACRQGRLLRCKQPQAAGAVDGASKNRFEFPLFEAIFAFAGFVSGLKRKQDFLLAPLCSYGGETMVFPDYDRSILSVSASILAHFGVQPRYPTLPELDAALAGKRKLLWVIADGLGSRALRRALPENAYLRRMTRATVTSVFPPTTTAATASYYSGKSPLEHGWLGWHLYFKEYAAEITTFTSTEYYTGSKRRVFPSPAGTLMPYETLFEQVRDPGLVTHALCGFPAWLERGADFTHRINSLEQGCAALRRIAQSDSSQFALMYWTQPDAEMHAHGTDSPQAKAQYRAVNDALERLSAQLFRDGCGDTLLLVTSDHGLVDVEETIDCAARPGLAQTLVLPPTIEARAASFFVKPHRMADFERWVQENLSGDFILMRRNEILESGLFGRGTPHAKFDDFVGDAMVIATGRRCLEYCPPGRAPEPLRARHAGLTEDEMLVDIMFDTGDMT